MCTFVCPAADRNVLSRIYDSTIKRDESEGGEGSRLLVSLLAEYPRAGRYIQG